MWHNSQKFRPEKERKEAFQRRQNTQKSFGIHLTSSLQLKKLLKQERKESISEDYCWSVTSFSSYYLTEWRRTSFVSTVGKLLNASCCAAFFLHCCFHSQKLSNMSSCKEAWKLFQQNWAWMRVKWSSGLHFPKLWCWLFRISRIKRIEALDDHSQWTSPRGTREWSFQGFKGKRTFDLFLSIHTRTVSPLSVEYSQLTTIYQVKKCHQIQEIS